MKKSMKALAVIISMTLVLAGCSQGESKGEPAPEAKKLKIGITQIIDHPALNASRDGFVQRLEELGIEADISMQDAQGDIANAQMIAEKFASDDVDLILSIATPTSQAAQNATKEAAIPVIFTAVSDPVFSGLLNNPEAPEANLTGVTDEISLENRRAMFEILKELNPEMKSVGVVFNTGESNSQVQIEDIEKVAAEFDIKVEKVGIAGITDINQALESLAKKSDAMMLINDNMIASSMELIAKTAKEKGIITISGDSSHVDSGALISVGISYFDLGVQAADMAKLILVEGTEISKIPVQSSKDFIKKVNTDTLNALGLDKNTKAFKDAEFTE
ncbi:ABC transporter substrate-binding protein [Proteocatella sphenisci]|uniref:ABC transporter substrate-binding protein n=1 Tax=Proteocatella sphenisci TaxID=181070 RepID=UPI0004BA9542|nr:ABC transporter substrate-binding protein [Proteocatella sphenisci]